MNADGCIFVIAAAGHGRSSDLGEKGLETMARIKPIEIFDHLNIPMRAALDEAVERALPGVEVDRRKLYLEFRRALADAPEGLGECPECRRRRGLMPGAIDQFTNLPVHPSTISPARSTQTRQRREDVPWQPMTPSPLFPASG